MTNQKIISTFITLLLLFFSLSIYGCSGTETVGNVQEEITLEHERPDGYDEPILTETVAMDICREAFSMLYEISHSAFTGKDYYEWVRNADNQVFFEETPETKKYYEWYFYFIPEISDMKKFDAYFGQVFTEDTLEHLKDEIDIFEYNGRLAGINLSAVATGSSMIDWYESVVDEIIQDEGSNTAIVKIKPYYYGYAFDLEKINEYKFEYSEDFGWRISLNELSDM